MSNPPCVILRSATRAYTAWNEDGRMIARHPSSYWCVHCVAASQGYEEVSPNSRLGRTIQDKLLNPYWRTR